MFKDKILLLQDLDNFDYEKTKDNVQGYFAYLQKLEWQLDVLKAQKELVSNYDFSVEDESQPYCLIGKDAFNLGAIEQTEKQIKKRLLSYDLAKSTLSGTEQLYIEERFINRKREKEIVDLLGISNSDSNEFRMLKRCAIYRFAYFFNLIVEKNDEKSKEKILKKKLGGK